MQTATEPTSQRPAARRRLLRMVTAAATVLALVVIGLGVRALVRGDADVFSPGAAKEFFRRYVNDEGRAYRPEDGDTVSEGQAYAMLLAVSLDDADRFAEVWRWTENHLQRSDGLLSWRWSDGSVADEQSAADADIDAAHALSLAGERFGVAEYSRESRRIAEAILDHEVLRVGNDHILVAGPWAVGARITNPSYFAPGAFDRFASSDRRWHRVRATSLDIAAELTDDGASLPPDWASIDRDGVPRPASKPDGAGAGAAYGLDAPRMVIRFAASCDGRSKAMAARAWQRFQGSTWSEDSHPVDVVAAAAAAHAAGVAQDRDRLLGQAERIASEHPSYYGWAWAALGPAMLDGKALSCS